MKIINLTALLCLHSWDLQIFIIDMLLTMGQQSKKHQNKMKNKEEKQHILQHPHNQVKHSQNPSISSPKSKSNLNSSISQKILNYTNQLRNYLISTLTETQNHAENKNNTFLTKMRTQSSKNVQQVKDGNTKQNKTAKSVKNVNITSKSQTSQTFYVPNQTFENEFNQKQSVQDHLKLTSLSKIVEKTQKKTDLEPKHSSQILNELQKRMSKLESIVQTLLEQKKLKQINLKGKSLSSLKQSHQHIIRRKPLINFQKKKYLSLESQTDKMNDLSKKKIEKKKDLNKISSKIIEDCRIKRNLKENSRPLYNLKKSNLKLNDNYHPVVDYMKSSKKVLFMNSKLQKNHQAPNHLQNKQI